MPNSENVKTQAGAAPEADKPTSVQKGELPKKTQSDTVDQLNSFPEGPEEKALRDYLGQIGLGAYTAAFLQHGVTSLKLLRMLDSATGNVVRKEICETIEKGFIEGKTTRPGSTLASNQVKTITADDVQARIEKEQTSEFAASELKSEAEHDKKKEKLQKAIDKVIELREKWAKAAENDQNKVEKQAHEEIDKLLGELKAEDLLKNLPSAKELGTDLNSQLTTMETALAKVNALTEAAVSKTPLSAVDLIFGHQLLRGRLIDANGMTEAPGGAVIAMPRRSGNADLFGPSLETKDFSRSYRSESELSRAERLIETHASSFVVAAEASGAAFMGTGIGAMSLSAQYAQAKESRTDTSSVSSTRLATEIQTRYHWAPIRQIVFATNEFRLSSDALSIIRSIIKLPNRSANVLEFMTTFGSHVFGRITLGGWYKYTARATAENEANRGDLKTAVASAINWAVSASATYTGLGGAGQVSAASKGKIEGATVSGREFRCTSDSYEVSISTNMLGGVDGLPREEWIGSVQYPEQWRVIQREAPVPIWTLIRHTDPVRLGAELVTTKEENQTDQDKNTRNMLDALADEFEKVWVQDIFSKSLDDKFYKLVVENKIVRSDNLQDFLKKQTAEILKVPPSISWQSDDGVKPIVNIANPGDWKGGPSMLVYRNTLHWFCVTRWGDFWTLIGCFFDGTTWRCSMSESYESMLPKGAIPVFCGTGKWHWADVEPAILELEDGKFLIAAPSKYDDDLYFGVCTPKFGAGITSNVPETSRAGDLENESKGSAANVSPALIRFGDGIYVIYADTNNNIVFRIIDESLKFKSTPATATKVKGITNAKIAASVFGNRLYVAYKSSGSNKLTYVYTDNGSEWHDPIELPWEIDEGPSLAVFNGPASSSLYCAYKGYDSEQPIYTISTSDGGIWSKPIQLRNTESAKSPALVAFTRQKGPNLYCFYKREGNKENVPIFYQIATWGASTSSSLI
ncbi:MULTISPECIES: MAC/perforin domain-containing protein [Methylomonas]|uniref:MACPF domain-containing protein n=2 Tax=Methylomonas TaxID=416 RepID=A0A140E5E8_9GAMM|nr:MULTISPECIES: MAC/perforin domain-containing protein [Methylomonas]AMK75622.1 hypothetical protein JT25_003825 [Methylomonas denitrificans]OAI08028.1 hypothetical protein A1342_19160 [Methylomonas methanica]TCV72456.1 MAC/Perforin domain-containing protein [Methylomonas methanica]